MLLISNFYQSKNIFNIEKIKKCFLSSKSAFRMISDGSCDTKDWSNDAENSALITGINDILKYIQVEFFFGSN